jgi:hypothetical protein
MTRREVRRRLALGVGALAALGLALVLALLALDVSRWDDAVASGDVRFRRAPADSTLWRARELVPAAAGRRVLALEDDLAFREAIRVLRLSRLDDPVVSDPALAIRRNEAQARLEAVVAGDADDVRRSRAAGLLGVLGLSRFLYETEDREALLSATVSSLRLAVDLDPGNDEAKYNLELAYQRGRGLRLTEGSAGANPAPGGSGSKGAGAGQPGSGY